MVKAWIKTGPMKRPTWVFLLGFALGIVLSQQIVLNDFVLILLCLMSAVFFLIKTSRRAGLFACALFLAFLRTPALPQAENIPDQVLTGVISHVGFGDDHQTLIVRLAETHDSIRIISEETGFQVGDVLSFRAKAERPMPALNPYAFDEARYLAARDIGWKAYVGQGQIKLVGRSGDLWLIFKRAFHDYISQSFDKALLPRHSDLMQSLILGAGTVDSDTSEAFRTLGLTHLLAISGLQVQIIAGLCLALLLTIGFHRYLAEMVTLVLLALYSALIGFPFSILRAVIAFAIGTSALLLGKHRDDLNALAMSAVIILLLTPYALFDIGFQLSMLATAALILLANRIPSPFLSRGITDAWQQTLAVQLGLFPLQMRYFNQWNPLMILMNLALVPLFGVFTTGAFAILLTGWLPFIPQALGLVLDPLVAISLSIVKTYASIEALNLILPSLPWIGVLCFYVLILVWFKGDMIAFLPKRIQERFLAFALLYSLLLPLTSFLFPLHRLTFIAIGQGDAVLLSSGRTHFLFDTGGSPIHGETRSGKILDHFLTSQGIKSLDGVWLSHPDADHVGNLDLLMNRGGVHAVYASPLTLAEVGPDHGIPIRTGDLFRGRGFEIDVIQTDDEALNPNDRSAVLLLKMGTTRVLLTGDIEVQGEEQIALKGLQADILKVPHHGSPSSSSQVFLDSLKPKTAIISVGSNNYGHPDPDVLMRYRERRIEVLRTDQDGAISIVSSILGTRIETFLKPPVNLLEWIGVHFYDFLGIALMMIMMIGFWIPQGRQDEL